MRMTESLPDLRDEQARVLDARIAAFIGSREPAEAEFERLAMQIFSYQFDRNAAYRQYCERSGATPGTVSSWRDVPPIPTSTFAAARIACFAPERTALIFESSGTTSRHMAASHLELDCADIYERSLVAHWKASVIPDAARLPLLCFGPPFAQVPRSSLAYMMSALERSGAMDGADFFLNDGTLDTDGAARALRNAQRPIAIFGTAIALSRFFAWCREHGLRFALPPGSRVVETGGFKGLKTISRESLYADFTELLGIPRALCISEYGMCELGSQWYDANLVDTIAGRVPRFDVKAGPHWTRTRIVDPVSAQPLRDGQPGLLSIFDLSNRGSALAILTSDLARSVAGGFELLGRHAGAVPKGCSIAIDALLEHAGD
jgi:hypothetical protein